MPSVCLSPEQEASAQALATRIREAAAEDILELARLLVSKPEHQIFGETEFQVRSLVQRVGAKAYEVHLAQKKTATEGPASNAPTANRQPSSRTTGRKHP